jgi:hypothetical protein
MQYWPVSPSLRQPAQGTSLVAEFLHPSPVEVPEHGSQEGFSPGEVPYDDAGVNWASAYVAHVFTIFEA